MGATIAMQIRDAMKSALADVSYVSESGETKSVQVVRTGRWVAPTQQSRWPSVHVALQGRDNTGAFTPVNRICPRCRFVITGVVKAPEDYEPDADRFAAEIEKTLAATPTWGIAGVIDTKVTDVRVGPVAAGKPWAACVLTAVVQYEYGFGAPDGE